jgi:hypothetical protein
MNRQLSLIPYSKSSPRRVELTQRDLKRCQEGKRRVLDGVYHRCSEGRGVHDHTMGNQHVDKVCDLIISTAEERLRRAARGDSVAIIQNLDEQPYSKYQLGLKK